MRPWHQVVTPRGDLREGRPLDASEFAVHLNQVASGTAPADYTVPERFFHRTYPTRGLREIATEVARRLAGETVNASPVINLTTQFGGGKTHALAMLYHLFGAGPPALAWPGVAELLEGSGVTPRKARVATFVGSRFDVVEGVTTPGEPVRRTPWGDIAWQLGTEAGYRLVAEQDRLRVRPGGDVLRRLLDGEPTLILMDEVLNYVSAARALKAGDADSGATVASQFLAFLQALSEEVSGRPGAVLVMALPKSELEMSPEDEDDFNRLRKLSSRVDRPYILSSDHEIPEIIRRRLFENLGAPGDRRSVARTYARWIADNHELLGSRFAAEDFEACYPFHPTVFSAFERKWQTLPNFQRTRGVLRLLALWISQTYQEAYRGGRRDPLVTLGLAPLGDRHFRAAVLEQLGESRLEGTIEADIAGPQSHAGRLDASANGPLRGHRLHQALATAVFFESSGGQSPERQVATLPELRMALGQPDLELGHLETALAELSGTCYYLFIEGAAYRFSVQANLNRVLSDVRASLERSVVDERMRDEVRDVFRVGGQLERRFFPEQPANVPNAASLALVVMAPENHIGEAEQERTLGLVRTIIDEAGASARTYKSALFFVVPGDVAELREATRDLMAWQKLLDPTEGHHLEADQQHESQARYVAAKRRVREAVWRSYHVVCFLGEDGQVESLDLGLLDPSAATTLTGYIESRLTQQDLLVVEVSASWLARHRPPALPEWPLRTVRDLFYSSPRFPRLRDATTLKRTIALGVRQGLFGLGERDARGRLVAVRFREEMLETDIDFTPDSVLLMPEAAEALLSPPGDVPAAPEAPPNQVGPDPSPRLAPPRAAEPPGPFYRCLIWRGVLPHGKWMLFYNRVLTKVVLAGGLTVRIEVESRPDAGLTPTQVAEVRQALADLELPPPEVTETDT